MKCDNCDDPATMHKHYEKSDGTFADSYLCDEGAKQSINALKRRKSIKCHIDRFSFWIMKQTLKAERVWEENNEPVQD